MVMLDQRKERGGGGEERARRTDGEKMRCNEDGITMNAMIAMTSRLLRKLWRQCDGYRDG